MNIAIIGCGFIAETHAAEVNRLGHRIITVIDADANRAKTFAEKYGAASYGTDFERALEEDVDSVHVCTPPNLHYDMVCRIIEAGKHVICEKPLCLEPEKARDLYDRAREKGIVAAVNFNVRYHEACMRAKETVAADDFGRICMIHGRYLQEFHVLPADYMWRYISELAGPMRATTEIGSHIFDLVRYISGLEIEAVSANYGLFNPVRFEKDGVMYREEIPGSRRIEVESDDAAVISLRFSNGAIGNILLSEVSHGRNNYVELEVTGTEKSVWWNSEEPYKLNSASKFSGVNTMTNAFGGGFPNTFGSFFEAVYADVINGRPSDKPEYPSFKDAYINSAICDAVYRSAKADSAWIKVE